MRVAIFLLCLCYLLLGGYAYSGIRHNSDTHVLHIKKNGPTKFINKNQSCPVVKENSPARDEAFLMMEDVEDEDTNNLSARKYKLLAKSFYALSYASNVTHLYSRIKASQSVHSLLSNKYITQRALRI